MADEYSPAFSKLPDDVVLMIFFQLEDDPRHWARLSCVCRKFSSLISTICCKSKCLSSFPSISADILSSPSPSSWASLFKLAVCCPGLLHSGLLLDNSDFGLHRDIGSDSDYAAPTPAPAPASSPPASVQIQPPKEEDHFGGWSLYDDLYFDTVYDNSESQDGGSSTPMDIVATNLGGAANPDSSIGGNNKVDADDGDEEDEKNKKRRRVAARRQQRAHLASGSWSLNREQGNKLLASRFRGDCLYISDWPGCVHMEEKRNYMLFRGLFKNFKRSRVWRTINDGNKSKIDLNCAFCSCKETWDLHSAFCLRRGFGFHDDGEPVVRAYVCENGHVSGAWTDLPLYT